MKKFRTLAFAAICSLAALVGCTEQVESPVFNLSASEITAAAEGGEYEIVILSNVAWESSSEADWAVLEPRAAENGGFGKVVVMVSKNDTFVDRETTITITSKAGAKTIKVSQPYIRVFDIDQEVVLTSAAQSFVVKVSSNMQYTVASDDAWIHPVSTKAAPVESSFTVAVDANASIETRTGTLVISAEDGTYTMKVSQGPADDLMELTSVKSLGTSMDPYDSDNWCPSNFEEYLLTFATSKGEVNLAVNVAEAGKFAGEYLVDDSDSHAANTFSIKSLVPVKYYTNVIVDGEEIVVVDGIVNIEESAAGLTVSVQLADEDENIYSYTCQGTLPEITVENSGAEASVNYYGDYNTHFATGTKQFDLSLYFSGEESGLYSLGFKLFADKSATNAAVPVGKYTITEEGSVDETLSYSNGINNYAAGTFVTSGGYANYDFETEDYDYVEMNDGTIEISEGSAEGLYNITVKANVVPWSYNDDWDAVYGDAFDVELSYTDVAIDITDNHLEPVEDGDMEFVSFPISNTYSGYYFGNAYNNGGTVFYAGWSSVNNIYNVYLTFQTSKPYTYEQNFNGRYCNTPIPDGTYTYNAASPSKEDGSADDVLCNVVTKSFRSIINSYTGTSFMVSGGSVTLSEGHVIFDVIGKSDRDGSEAHFTGDLETSCYYFRDYSTNATWLARVKWVE